MSIKKYNIKCRRQGKRDVFLRGKHGSGSIGRRTFLSGAVGFIATLLLSPVVARTVKSHASALTEDPWQTLSIVQDHLFPSEANSPGAKEINAISYLRNMLADPVTDTDEKEFILNGVKWLNELAVERHEAVFMDLTLLQQSALLQQISKTTAGRNWISKLLSYLLEALLSDPVYGGNPDGVGWKWLEHRPGYPRPPMNKRYYDLLKI
ncbi:MAG: gluconate 2-dehydrogenase subunit 3 family protein [Candidatus Brocadiaceae bacterium]|nr:gluconate 2-dehydrogenase subunit 3 family protein [Candidatus Brocadiaceae bacterium]